MAREAQKLSKEQWMYQYMEIVSKYNSDTGSHFEVNEWDCYQQYYVDGYSPQDGFNEDINTN